MRVLHAASFFGRTPGGFIPLVLALARRLTERGDTFALAVPDVPDAGWHAAARAAGIELRLVRDGGDAARFARSWRPDVAHVHFFGWEARVTAALWPTTARIFWHVHSTVTSRPNGLATTSLRSLLKYRGLGARVERFIAVSDSLADELVRQGAPRGKIAAVRNAVDARRFRPPTALERRAARAALDLDDRPAIIFFGRDPRIKGADLLADALVEMDRPTLITVATPAPVRAELARYANVVAIDHADDVVPLLWAADALAIPSRAEGFGLVLLEAALTGLPFAASDLPTLREAADGRPGASFAPVGDASALARALAESVRSPRGAQLPTDGASLDGWVDAIAALYRAA